MLVNLLQTITRDETDNHIFLKKRCVKFFLHLLPKKKNTCTYRKHKSSEWDKCQVLEASMTHDTNKSTLTSRKQKFACEAKSYSCRAYIYSFGSYTTINRLSVTLIIDRIHIYLLVHLLNSLGWSGYLSVLVGQGSRRRVRNLLPAYCTAVNEN